MTEHQRAWIDNFIDAAIQEDVGPGDHTSLACIDPEDRSTGHLKVKDIGIVAGVELAAYIFRKVDPSSTVNILIEDGHEVNEGDVVFEIEANTQKFLIAERLVLNCMQRMSGIATLSSRFRAEVEHLPVTILDTRKTTPLIRVLEKWAVEIGGCSNYRDGLYDWIMIKDNHIKASGSISKAIDKVAQYLKQHQLDLGITIEVKNLVELYEVVDHGGVTRIMLDNFELPLLREAVAVIGNQFEIEASGGIDLYSIREVAATGVNYISVGALTHSAGILDLSLKIVD